MTRPQPGILAPLPRLSRYLRLQRLPGADVGAALKDLAAEPWGDDRVLGLGAGLVASLGGTVPPLRPFPALAGPSPAIPATPGDLWVWLRGDDHGDLVYAAREIDDVVGTAFELDDIVDGFVHRDSRDLTGFVDGTENPTDDAAQQAAIAGGASPLAGSSFVAVQRWEHDLDAFEELDDDEQDLAIGRRRADDSEIEDAPPSAHVKRAEQDDTGFVLRRSMPWADPDGEGLVFVAFGADFEAYELQLRRMAGVQDGVVDALFAFSRPVDGAYYWCPPLRSGRLDLRALGL